MPSPKPCSPRHINWLMEIPGEFVWIQNVGGKALVEIANINPYMPTIQNDQIMKKFFWQSCSKNSQDSNDKKIFFKKILLLGKATPINLLINLFPSLLLMLILDKNFIGINFAIIWSVLNNCVMQLGYLWIDSDFLC